MKKYNILKVCYNPPLSNKSISEILTYASPSMTSIDGDTNQYNIGFLLAGLEEWDFNPEDVEILKELQEQEIDYIEI
jgi:hypothetical protein